MANLIKRSIGTPFTFKAAGGDAVLTLTSKATNTYQVGAQFDRGGGSLPREHLWEFKCKLQATPTLGATIDLYLHGAQSDPTMPDGDVGQAVATPANDKKRNAQWIGSVEIDVAGTGYQKGSGYCFIDPRYISPGVFNGSGATFSATAGDYELTFTPVVPEIQ